MYIYQLRKTYIAPLKEKMFHSVKVFTFAEGEKKDSNGLLTKKWNFTLDFFQSNYVKKIILRNSINTKFWENQKTNIFFFLSMMIQMGVFIPIIGHYRKSSSSRSSRSPDMTHH